MDIQPGSSHSAAGSVPVTLGGVTVGNAVSGQQTVQLLVLRPPGPHSVRPGGPTGGTSTRPTLQPRVNGSPGLASNSPRFVTLAPSVRSVGQLSSPTLPVIRNIQQPSTSAGSSGTQIYLVSPIPSQPPRGTAIRPNFKLPSSFSVRLPVVNPATTTHLYLTPHPGASGQSQESTSKRGRKTMTQHEKDQAKKEREKSKPVNGIGAKKKQVRRKKKDVAPAVDYTSEMNDLKKKIHGRYEQHKKSNIKKEDAGYFGPYVRTYRKPDGDRDEGVPLPNAIVDTFESHLDVPDTNKTRFQLEKPKSVTLTGPFVCHFCHFDPSAEREASLGDLIGPIPYPNAKRRRMSLSKKTHEETENPFFYTHEKCLEWASNFRMVGYEIVELENVLEDAKVICSICSRRGATIGCSAPVRCKKAFHYPCVRLNSDKTCKMVPSSHQVFCEEHMDIVERKHRSEHPASQPEPSPVMPSPLPELEITLSD